MKKIFLSVLIICYGIASVAGQTVKIDSLTVARFGKVHIYTTGSGSPQNLIIMISGDGGWKYGVHEFAKEFSKMNSIVASVDILRYYEYLRKQNEDCYMVSSDFVELATDIEREYNFPDFLPPVDSGFR